MRLKTRWHNKGAPKAPEQIASALAFITWKVILAAIDHMEKEGFVVGSSEQHFRVAMEMAAFMVQAADRHAYGRLEEGARGAMINAMAKRLAEIVEENGIEILGPGEYRAPFIATLNERLGDYAEFPEGEGGAPSYAALRYLGEKVSSGMDAVNRKWVLEQVVDVEGPELVKQMRKALGDLVPAAAV